MIPLRDDNPTTRLPIVTILLIALNVVVYFLVQPIEMNAGVDFTFETAAIPEELATGEPLTEAEFCAVLNPASAAFSQVATTADVCASPSTTDPRFPTKSVYLAAVFSMFLHGGILHLGGNMLYLWIFGNNIEDHLGRIRYLAFYLFAGVVATAAHVLGDLGSTIPVVGASGAVAGVMGAYLVWFPWARVRTLVAVFPLRVKAWILLAFWFGSQFFISLDDGVAWLAHVGGFLVGVLIALIARSQDTFRDRLWTHKYRTQHPGAPWDPRFGGREPADQQVPAWFQQ